MITKKRKVANTKVDANKAYSLKEASEKLNLKKTAITAVANGSRKNHKGFIFTYVI